jgi:deoxyribodipyrimidine photo-lyase
MTLKKYRSGLMWFRRDLRIDDNAALYHALKSCEKVYALFVFDTDILAPLSRADRRVEFIRDSLVELDEALSAASAGSAGENAALIVKQGRPAEILQELTSNLGIEAVFCNRDDEPYSRARDAEVQALLHPAGIAFHDFKDHLIFERGELLTLGAKPYTVFTPYKNCWLRTVDDFYLKPYPVQSYVAALASTPRKWRSGVPTLKEIGFEKTNLSELAIPTGISGGNHLFGDFVDRMSVYGQAREFPSVKGGSYLSVHLRFGTISIRRLAAAAMNRQKATEDAGAGVWLSELIWRDFYAQILANFPHVATHAFKPEYDAIRWESGDRADQLFAAWCKGQTGFPLVDAAMKQLEQTGYMHNRLRMVSASFLIKDLGIDYRLGERFFAEKLNDYELASNNGGWQWAASSGCDAQPYFRIFNPVSQSQKFDAEGKFIHRYLPQLSKLPPPAAHAPWQGSPVELLAAGVTLGDTYPTPIVEHDEARARTLERYAVVKKLAA